MFIFRLNILNQFLFWTVADHYVPHIMLHMFKILLINNVQQYKCSGVVDVSSWTCTLGGA